MTTTALLTLCQTVCPAGDGRTPEAGVGAPHVVVYGGTPQPADFRLDHTHKATARDWQAVCVSNSPHSARTVADQIARAVDRQHAQPGHRFRVVFASQPIEDRDDPSQWRWSATVEITLTTGR